MWVRPLYRHFPTYEDLLAAALEVRGDALMAELQRLRGISDPDEGLRGWLRALEECLGAFSGLPDPLIGALASHDSPLAVPHPGTGKT
ncbi:hypothetical protein [Streptomyces sp. ME19-01-6]|uniref:TetR/AcrR family transcriptional regulator n=1 Tax=Streptomyces sp. ME19-01-6 TaxID=3028686 RepID=UPI0029B6C0B4|nr:hypothetical protein [Streptomyces sp. ME19-01-6]MDX3225843.1 hypothetical protein [Streptomyces sp. ME19-01-6]